MKQYLLMLCLSLCFVSQAQAVGFEDWDGCYQLTSVKVKYPMVCLRGAINKKSGENGAGAQILVFPADSIQLIGCGAASSLRFEKESLQYLIGTKTEMSLKSAEGNQSPSDGVAYFAEMKMLFLKVDNETAASLFATVAAEPKCQNLQPGTFVNLQAE